MCCCQTCKTDFTCKLNGNFITYIHDANNGFPDATFKCVSSFGCVHSQHPCFPSCPFCWSPFSSEVAPTLQINLTNLTNQSLLPSSSPVPLRPVPGRDRGLSLGAGIYRWSEPPTMGIRSSGSSTHAQVQSHLPRKRFLMNDPLWSSRTSVIRSCPRFRQQFS